MKYSIIIFTDGSALGNPGPGGWGAVVAQEKKIVELGGREAHTTNNRMELMGAIRALDFLKKKKGDVVIYTDSQYVIRGITEWIFEWKKRNWMTKSKAQVLNRDLWIELSNLVNARKKNGAIKWKHVAGHVGIAGNERADEIATHNAEGLPTRLFNGKPSAYSHNLNNIIPAREKSASKKSTKLRSRAKAYSYLSFVGGVFKRHETWADCERHVKGVSGAKFKKALSAEEENIIRKEWGV